MLKNRLREIRHELQIDSQTEMANLLELSQQQYNNYERQETQPSLETALKIASKLKRPVEKIFFVK